MLSHDIDELQVYYMHQQHFNYQLTHTTLKNVDLLKLLQHVSVYRETIIRELQSVLS